MKNDNGNCKKNPSSKGYALFYVDSINFSLSDEFIEFKFLKEIPSPVDMIQDLSFYDSGVFCYIYECDFVVTPKNINFKFGNLVTMFGGFESYGL